MKKTIQATCDDVIKGEKQKANIVIEIISRKDANKNINTSFGMKKILVQKASDIHCFNYSMLFFSKKIICPFWFRIDIENWHYKNERQENENCYFVRTKKYTKFVNHSDLFLRI